MISISRREAVRIAISSIVAHKLRSFLTLIGIIIGVASVVVVGACISGMNSYVTERVARVLGANHFMIARMASSGRISDEEWERRDRRNKVLGRRDFDWVSRYCPTCEEVGAQVQTRLDLRQGGQEMLRVQISGVTANMAAIEDKGMRLGRFIQPHEVEHPALVCVIGQDVADRFFPGGEALGQRLQVRGVGLRVVGVEEPRGSMFGQPLDQIVYMPLTTYGRLFGRHQSLQIHGLADSRERLAEAGEEARMALRNRHKLRHQDDDDFGMVDVAAVNQDVDRFTGSIAMVVTPITLISLVVGGIVVMNIMLVSVNERTFEIGLRKAIGARRREILIQFLVESALLCVIGGLLGLGAAIGIAALVAAATPIPMTITAGYVVLSVVVSATVGVAAGIYPAWRAARLDPVVALSRL